MGLRMKKLCLIVIMVLVATGCWRESQQTHPVTTRSDSGISTAPAAKDAAQRNNALVRVISTVPGNPSVDVYADHQKLFGPITFRMVTPYKEMAESRPVFRVRTMGDTEGHPFTEESASINSGRHYTLLIMPDTNDRIRLRVINDNLVPASPDKSEIRVIHTSPDAGNVDVVAKQSNSKLFSDVSMGAHTSYTNLDPTSGNLEVRSEGQSTALATIPKSKLDKGKLYTIVVTGRLRGAPKLEALVIEDQVGITPTGATD